MKKQLSLNEVVAHVMWWKKPEDAPQNKAHITAYVMTYGTLDEVVYLMDLWGRDAFIAVLTHPPAGIFDPRSWHFWHLYLEVPLKPLPRRFAI